MRLYSMKKENRVRELWFVTHKAYLYMHGASRLVDGLFQVRELEALGLRETLSWIKNLGLYRVIFESD